MVKVIQDARGLYRTEGAKVNIAFSMKGFGPTVVLLHGTSAQNAVWAPVQEKLASHGICAISLDQRGHGLSDKPLRGYSGPDFVDDVITVLEALQIERAVVAGHSLGARNAWLSAAFHPERIAGVVAVDYTPFVESTVLDGLAERVAGGDRTFKDVAEIQDYLSRRYPRIHPDAVARRAREGYHLNSEGKWKPLADPGAMQQLIEGLRTPWDKEFGRIEAPMTHIRGLHSEVVSSDAWETAKTLRPRDNWHLVPDADHYVPEERPDIIANELVTTALER